VRYLRRFREADQEGVSAPNACESCSVVQDRLLALTGEFAELAAPLADEIAQSIRDRRPAPGVDRVGDQRDFTLHTAKSIEGRVVTVVPYAPTHLAPGRSNRVSLEERRQNGP